MKVRLFLLALILLLSFPFFAQANPPPKDEEQTRAQGIRGCPEKLGELILLGKAIKTQLQEPTLLFWVNTQKTETILVAINSPDLNEITPVFWQKLVVTGTGYLPVTIRGNLLQTGVRYSLTAGVLCQDSAIYASTLETSVTRVDEPSPTRLDRTILTYLSRGVEQVNVEKVESRL